MTIRKDTIMPCTAILLTLTLFLLDTHAEGERPNILLIMADDMGYECVTANGGESYSTPHIDQLAATGMRFENCHSQPICTPSRVQIMTGKYNSRNYVQFGLLQSGSHTFGNHLRNAGYETCIVGKWQLDGGLDAPNDFGFDDYCLWQVTRRPNRYPNPGLEINGKEVDFNNGEYGPDIVTDHACDFIDRRAAGEKPFFLYYPMILPHWPFEPTPDSEEWDPTFRRGDQSEKSRKTKWEDKYFADMVAYTDKMVGKLVAKLEELGLRENTLILFTGDNGTYTGITSRFNGRDWRGGKGHMMDNGTHVALVANMPGTIPTGRVNSDLIDFSDFFPTLAEFAGAELPADVRIDGGSFAPQLRGELGDPREHIYCWYFRNGKPVEGGDDHRAGESARNHRYKLYRDGGFHDVTRDFYETDPLDPEDFTAEQRSVRETLHGVIEQYTRPGFYEQ
ncbi:MAG: sulfatase-like hydrolase/transferase [Planctomycetota bacterium]